MENINLKKATKTLGSATEAAHKPFVTGLPCVSQTYEDLLGPMPATPRKQDQPKKPHGSDIELLKLMCYPGFHGLKVPWGRDRPSPK